MEVLRLRERICSQARRHGGTAQCHSCSLPEPSARARSGGGLLGYSQLQDFSAFSGSLGCCGECRARGLYYSRMEESVTAAVRCRSPSGWRHYEVSSFAVIFFRTIRNAHIALAALRLQIKSRLRPVEATGLQVLSTPPSSPDPSNSRLGTSASSLQPPACFVANSRPSTALQPLLRSSNFLSSASLILAQPSAPHRAKSPARYGFQSLPCRLVPLDV